VRRWRRARDAHARGGRIGWYFRARLHRRLFLWFGVAILATGLAVGLATALSSPWAPFRGDNAGLAAVVGDRFARVWDDPAERDAFARTIADELRLSVSLAASDGAALVRLGEPCGRGALTVPVRRDGRELGAATFCAAPQRFSHTSRLFLSIGAALFVLWALSGRVARRLARPLGELARVAEAIGQGRYEARAELRRADGEVGLLGVAIHDMAARIERQLADQRELLATVSHEIRTPLARIRLLVEMGRDGAAPAGALDEIDREVVEIDRLVGELLASSRVDLAVLTRTEQGAADAARRALERAGKPEARLQDVSGGARFSGDATLVARALANLIDNADQHGGGLAALVVRAGDGRVAFEALDEGPGLAAGDERAIFEAFVQRSRGRERGSLGLGLSLVRRIAEAHGGVAGAANRPEGGARVWLELPALDG
jgi:signal transduction histidine kinase